jgi:hypothetical protein
MIRQIFQTMITTPHRLIATLSPSALIHVNAPFRTSARLGFPHPRVPQFPRVRMSERIAPAAMQVRPPERPDCGYP